MTARSRSSGCHRCGPLGSQLQGSLQASNPPFSPEWTGLIRSLFFCEVGGGLCPELPSWEQDTAKVNAKGEAGWEQNCSGASLLYNRETEAQGLGSPGVNNGERSACQKVRRSFCGRAQGDLPKLQYRSKINQARAKMEPSRDSVEGPDRDQQKTMPRNSETCRRVIQGSERCQALWHNSVISGTGEVEAGDSQ